MVDNNKKRPQGDNKRPTGKRNDKANDRLQEKDRFESKLIDVNRVTKVVKGGRTMRLSALVVCGDGNGLVGIGMGKAVEVPVAISKASNAAKKNLITIKLVNNTIPHEVLGVYGSSKVVMLPAEEGTGLIAGGPVRKVLEVTGIKNIRTKSLGSNNPINCAKAVLAGLASLKTVEDVAHLRGIEVDSLSNYIKMVNTPARKFKKAKIEEIVVVAKNDSGRRKIRKSLTKAQLRAQAKAVKEA